MPIEISQRWNFKLYFIPVFKLMKQITQNAIFTNTNTIYLIFLAYLIFTEFEHPSMFFAVGHALRAFFLWRLVNKRILRGRIRKDSSLPFFLIFFFFSFFSFFSAGLGLVLTFYIGVVELRWLISGSTGTQWEMSIDRVNKPVDGLFYMITEILTYRSSYAFSNLIFGIYNFMEDSFNVYTASYRIATFIYW